MSFVLTTPAASSAVSGVNTITGVVVPAGTTKEVDFLQCTLYRGGKWILTLTNNDTGECMQQTISVHINSDCTAITHTRYAVIGTIIPHGVTVELDGSPVGASIKVVNPSGSDYIADFTRIDLFE